jgi:Domain of unknown function (DUF1877)
MRTALCGAVSMIGNLRLVSAEQLTQLLADPRQIEDFLYESDEPSPDDEDIDKAWHGLHFLLTGSAWDGHPPLNFLVSGGQEVGDVDVGYGPARAFTAREVAEIWAALEQITSDDLRSRFDGKQLMAAQIYPEIWDRDLAEDETLGYLVEHFDSLKAFLERGAQNSSALLVYIT